VTSELSVHGQRHIRPRVVAVSSHPIQYQAPWFRALAEVASLDFSVMFVDQPDAQQQGRGFGLPFQWDVPLLDGYPWQLASDVNGSGALNGFFSARLGSPRKLLRELKPDVLLLTGWHVWPLIQLLIAAWRLRVPVVMRGDSNALRPRRWHARLFHRLLLRRCSAFLTTGRANRDFYRCYGIAEQQLFDAPHFVDNERFMESAEASAGRRDELRRRWSIPPDAVCFCYAGKLEPKKRIMDLLEALRLAVPQSAQTLYLLVVGTGDLLPQARAMAQMHALPVTFAGFLNQSEIPEAYTASDCLVLPSDFGETWGLVVNEAMACGRPAIVSDRVGCGPDLVSNGSTGAVFPFGDTAALAKVLVDLASAPEQLQAMGARARRLVLTDYCIQRSVAGTARAVDYVLGL
jgi:glycosyltransferase involved in cell wall biosynthesis